MRKVRGRRELVFGILRAMEKEAKAHEVRADDGTLEI